MKRVSYRGGNGKRVGCCGVGIGGDQNEEVSASCKVRYLVKLASCCNYKGVEKWSKRVESNGPKKAEKSRENMMGGF